MIQSTRGKVGKRIKRTKKPKHPLISDKSIMKDLEFDNASSDCISNDLKSKQMISKKLSQSTSHINYLNESSNSNVHRKISDEQVIQELKDAYEYILDPADIINGSYPLQHKVRYKRPRKTPVIKFVSQNDPNVVLELQKFDESDDMIKENYEMVDKKELDTIQKTKEASNGCPKEDMIFHIEVLDSLQKVIYDEEPVKNNAYFHAESYHCTQGDAHSVLSNEKENKECHSKILKGFQKCIYKEKQNEKIKSEVLNEIKKCIDDGNQNNIADNYDTEILDSSQENKKISSEFYNANKKRILDLEKYIFGSKKRFTHNDENFKDFKNTENDEYDEFDFLVSSLKAFNDFEKYLIKGLLKRPVDGYGAVLFDLFTKKRFIFSKNSFHYFTNDKTWIEMHETAMIQTVRFQLEKIASEIRKIKTKNDLFIKSAENLSLEIGNTIFIKRILKSLEINLYQKYDPTEKPETVNFLNGTFDLTTFVFRPCHKKEYNVIHTKYNYDINISTKIAEDFMKQIMPDKEIRDFFLSKLAYSFKTSLINEHVIFLKGLGANGKTLLCHLISKAFGSYHSQLPDTILTKVSSVCSSKPRPEFIDLMSARVSICSEFPSEKKIMSSQLKKLAGGGEQFSFRRLFSNEIEQFNFNSNIIIACNKLPNFSDCDNATKRRIIVIEMNQSFVDEPLLNHEVKADPELLFKIKNENEFAQSFMNLLIEYYKLPLQKIPQQLIDNEDYNLNLVSRNEIKQFEEFLSNYEITENKIVLTLKDIVDDFIKESLVDEKFASEIQRAVLSKNTETYQRLNVAVEKTFSILFGEKYSKKKRINNQKNGKRMVGWANIVNKHSENYSE